MGKCRYSCHCPDPVSPPPDGHPLPFEKTVQVRGVLVPDGGIRADEEVPGHDRPLPGDGELGREQHGGFPVRTVCGDRVLLRLPGQEFVRSVDVGLQDEFHGRSSPSVSTFILKCPIGDLRCTGSPASSR